jgi:glycerophosphoryl diester phosphodiesterase
VLGHRGASQEAPENTLAAFSLGLEQGADGMELDVWRCATGEIAVVHDRDTGRLADRKLRITAATWDDLRTLDIGRWKGERFTGERIPRLEEVFERFPSAVVNVELKAAHIGDPRLAVGVAGIIERYRAEDRVIVSSFDPTLLAALRVRAPHLSTGLLFAEDQALPLRHALAAPLLGTAALHPSRRMATPERVRRWRQRGYAVNVWTVDGDAEMAALCQLGASAIITNVPARARSVVRAATGR